MTDKKATGQFLVRLDPDLHHELRRFTCDHGISMREIVENAIDAYLRDRRSGAGGDFTRVQ